MKMATIIIVAIAAVLGLGSYFYTKNPNNPVEKAAEEVIDYELHLPPGSVDLTPDNNNG